MESETFLTLPLAQLRTDELIDWLTEPEPAATAPRAAAYLNAHTVNLALRAGSALKEPLKKMDMVYADGMSVVKAARRRGIDAPERVSAADFFLRFCWTAAARKRSLALVGGAPGVAAGCAQRLKEIVPGLDIVCHQDGYFRDGSEEEKTVVAALKAAAPAIVLVGMGSPRQEGFALRLRDEAGLPTIWCVGALFEYYTPGIRRHAPLWMRERGLEWVYRLMQEPRRMAGRYLGGNIEFFLRTHGIL